MAEKFFSFTIKDDGVYCTLYPATQEQPKARLEDIIHYAEKVNISSLNLVVIKELIAKSEVKPATAKVCEGGIFPSNELGVYTMAPDFMTVKAVFYPEFEGASQLTADEITRDLYNMGVKSGICEDAIKDFISNRIYGKEYILAKGTPVVEGRDGEIVYDFDTDLKPVPKIDEDGTVDFKNIDNLNHVKVGDVVARIIPMDKGTAGEDVMGRTVMPKRVKRVVFKYGKNMHVSEDGLSLISDVSGHVSLESEKIFVSDLLTLVNVDNSTGNIKYDGNVEVSGNVVAGFEINASGNVTVRGLVEGAIITAGGDITLIRGVQGMNKAVLTAGGNIVSKFIESAECVTADGNIESDSILHSKVISHGKITVNGRNGLIIGGDVRATKMIEVKTIGNEMGTATCVGVGVDADMKRRIDTLKKEIQAQGVNKIQLEKVLDALRRKQGLDGALDPAKQEMLQKTVRHLLLLDQKLKQDQNELDECLAHLEEDVNARVRVYNTAYVGTKFVFGDIALFLKQKYDYCQFVKDGADIKSIPI